MTEEHFPETPQEINRVKLAMFTNAYEYHSDKEDKSRAEVEWLNEIPTRIAELEANV
jgi:hypothetical protein